MAWEPLHAPEAALESEPLFLLGANGSGNAKDKETIIWGESRRCFAFRWPSLLDQVSAKRFFQDLQASAPWDQLRGRHGNVVRSTCWYVRNGCSCGYTYGNARVGLTRSICSQFKKTMEDLTALVFSSLAPGLSPDLWPNSANLNYYADGLQSVGWHADDESLFGGKCQDCSIVSLSLGGRREFWIALKDAEAEPIKETVVEVDLQDGDVLSMEGMMQKHTVHFLTREPHHRAPFWPPRINITWRWIVNHRPCCFLRHSATSAPCAKDLHVPQPFPGERVASSPWMKPWPDEFQHPPKEWRCCMQCRHNGWQGGRNCVEVKGEWLCRHCASACRGQEVDPTDRMVEELRRRLVGKVKLLQKKRCLRNSWESFCDRNQGFRDPGRYSPTLLLSWLESVDEVPEDLQKVLQEAQAELATMSVDGSSTKEKLVIQGDQERRRQNKLLQHRRKKHPDKAQKGGAVLRLDVSELYIAARRSLSALAVLGSLGLMISYLRFILIV